MAIFGLYPEVPYLRSTLRLLLVIDVVALTFGSVFGKSLFGLVRDLHVEFRRPEFYKTYNLPNSAEHT